MKYQVVYRTEAGSAEIHSASCKEWGYADYGADIVVDADHLWGAAIEAWSHDTEPEYLACSFTTFWPCLMEGYVAGAPRARTRKPTRRHVPFDPDEDTAAEIMEACYGKRLKWTNAISGKEEEARLYPAGPHYKMIRGVSIETHPHKYTELTHAPDGARILNFISAGVESAFRAVRLDSIISVK